MTWRKGFFILLTAVAVMFAAQAVWAADGSTNNPLHMMSAMMNGHGSMQQMMTGHKQMQEMMGTMNSDHMQAMMKLMQDGNSDQLQAAMNSPEGQQMQKECTEFMKQAIGQGQSQ